MREVHINMREVNIKLTNYLITFHSFLVIRVHQKKRSLIAITREFKTLQPKRTENNCKIIIITWTIYTYLDSS